MNDELMILSINISLQSVEIPIRDERTVSLFLDVFLKTLIIIFVTKGRPSWRMLVDWFSDM
jgi:hypothetical protein